MRKSRVVIIRYDEIGLKGRNQKFFIDCLVRNIRRKLVGIDIEQIRSPRGRILVELPSNEVEKSVAELKRIPGIASFSVGVTLDRDFDVIADLGVRWMEPLLDKKGSLKFCVRTQRSDKLFPFNSMDCDREIGSRIMSKLHTRGLSVSINSADFIVEVEIGNDQTIVFNNRIPGLRGLPIGCAGSVLSLLSGGIDSPVASFKMARRGCCVHFIFFENLPFLGRAGRDKVVRLARRVNSFQGGGTLYLVPFEEIQNAIRDQCRPRNRVVLYRRMMYRIAQVVAKKSGCLALVTGESLGQVASQTLENLLAVSSVVSTSVFRPLIGMDKLEIIEEARRIDTYETSIESQPDCCSVFMPPNPATRAKMSELEDDESRYPLHELINRAVEKIEVLELDNSC